MSIGPQITKEEKEDKIILPYKLYKLQEKYAEEITNIVSDGGVLLMEAGTGFGKTIANLYGSLLAKENGIRDYIIYLSKTHQQNRQIIKELRKLNSVNADMSYYAVQLASRSQLCHVKDVRDAPFNSIAIELCQKHRKDRRKTRSYEDCISTLKKAKTGGFKVPIPLIADLSDLRKLSDKYGGCAYLTARDLIPSMDIIVGHYYYFLSESIREAAGLPDENVTLILDEGHNLEDVCCNLMSRRIDSNVVIRAIEELDYIKNTKLDNFIQKFLLFIRSLDSYLEKGDVLPLSIARFTKDIESFSIDKEAIKVFQFEYSLLREDLLKVLKRKYKREVVNTNIDRISAFLEVIYFSPTDYGIVLERRKLSTRTILQVRIECLNPALLFLRAKKLANSVIICSGTLSPLELTAELLGVKNEAKFKAWGSVINPTNVRLFVIPKSPSTRVLSTSYHTRKNLSLFDDYRESILRITKQIPGGTLVFFPSYSLLEQVNLPSRFKDLKIFSEVRNSRENELVIEDYKSQIDISGQAVLAGVFGGKLSEGADFPGKYTRAIIVCGIPYAPVKDPLVTLKKAFYDSIRQGLGTDWYRAEAFRKVSQGLGRGWRGRDDYAMGFLLDNRFTSPQALKMLPMWLKNRTSVAKDWLSIDDSIELFFNKHDTK